jgi:hypothetical protein
LPYTSARRIENPAGALSYGHDIKPENPVNPMKNLPRTPKSTSMSPDAYAGFLKLWLTPSSKAPRQSAEVDAYLRYANKREPLSDATRRAIGQPTEQAA